MERNSIETRTVTRGNRPKNRNSKIKENASAAKKQDTKLRTV